MSTAKKSLTTCEPKTAVAYARYSSASQRDVSIEQQLKDIREYAEREGYTIIHEYADRAKSGFKNSDRRTEFQAMLLAASSGAFDTVIAWKVDRFGRNRRESATFKGQLADQGVSVVYAMEPIPDGAAGCLTEGMLEAIAEWYSRNLSENTKRGLYDNAAKCLYNGHHPYGYRKSKDNHLEICEHEAPVVRRIYNLYSQGYSYASISRILTGEGIFTMNGIPFPDTSIRSIIKNETYAGVYCFGNYRIQGGVPAIIDRELWDMCQELRAKTTRHRENNPEEAYLSGKCICGHCGAMLYGVFSYGSNNKKNNYYVCKNKAKKLCDTKYIHRSKIEDPLFDVLFNEILYGKTLDRFIDAIVDLLAKQKEVSVVEKLKNEHKDVLRKIDNINLAISNGVWVESTVEMLKRLTEQEQALKKRIVCQSLNEGQSISAERIRFYLYKLASGDRNDKESLKALINTFINSVTVYDNEMRVVINAVDHVGTVPPDELPPIDSCIDINRIKFHANSARSLHTVDQYPVIIFKIAI